MKLNSHIFEYHSSPVNWCEPDYAVSQHTAEFWNSVTNIPMLIVAPIMMHLYRDFACVVPHCKRVNIVWGLVVVIGIGSIYFHSTLSLFGQFMDEVAILWMTYAIMAMWTHPSLLHLPKYFENHRAHYQYLLCSMAVISTFLGFLKPELNHFFLFAYWIPLVKLLRELFQIKFKDRRVHQIGKNGSVVLLVAFLCWLSDRMICNFWLAIRFPYMHAIWHILMLTSGYYLSVFVSFGYAWRTLLGITPSLKFWRAFPFTDAIGLYYVGFD
uniref:alkaline ceramidase-like isoform X2 n=1 Tax=Ciona intestinalis TaxID=7719 RepID=UPI000180D43F|nr:alkaline ceramidase-like isoform X2 [Ciona intestinalis]|eukprot:XP_009858189.1 alkaline ceramidase-like isoform X2 [Ciona intestinalis]